MLTLNLSAYSFPHRQPGDHYIAICSPNLEWLWQPNSKYGIYADYALANWHDLPQMLHKIHLEHPTCRLILDFDVHGDKEGTGLFLQYDVSDTQLVESRANFGYIVNCIDSEFVKHKPIVMFESCFAGRAYKHTIRENEITDPKDCVFNYPTVPKYHIYGAGDNFAVWANPMYYQYRLDIKICRVDLRDYDTLGKDKPLLPLEPEDSDGMSPTTIKLKQIYESVELILH